MVESLFGSALRVMGVKPNPEKTRAYLALEEAYQAGTRAYHNLRHIERVLEALLTMEEDLDPMDSARATLAVIYHDVVYDPQRDDNEARSATFMREALAPLGVEEADLVAIERLILATKDHRPTDALSALVVDADLSILSAPEAEYDAYAAAIRREYAHVPDEAYRSGRRRVLEGLLSRRLFASPLMDEEAARANIARELAGL